MSENKNMSLKPVIDEAEPEHIQEQIIMNELGYFHSAAETEVSGVSSSMAVSQLPSAQLGDFLKRMTKIASGTLLTTNTVYQIVMSTIDPWDLFLNNPVISSKVSNFKYIRGTMEVQIAVNAPAGAYGLYYLVAFPNGILNPDGIETLSMNVSAIENVPHVAIDISRSTDGKLVLPWIHWNDYADLRDVTTNDGYKGMWNLRLYCLQPIGTGTGDEVPQASYRIWSRLTDDYDMTIPYNQMKRNFDETRSSVNSASINATGMKPSGIAGAISTGVGAIGNAVPFLKPFTTPVSAIAAGVGTVMSWFGFTRTADQQTPTVYVNRPYSNVANMDCNDTSEIAALSASNAITMDPRVSAPLAQDEAAFNYLFSKWILIGSAEWTPSQEPQADIVNFPVTPFISRTAESAGAVYTTAGFVGYPFSYWRGDMEYKIVVPLSKFHRGVLQVSWTPDISTIPIDITNVRFNHILDFGACASWEFSVGYASALPMLPVIPKVFNSTILSLAGANGMISITVSNPLIAQSEIAATRVFVFARAKPNMDFAVPRTICQHTSADGSLSAPVDFATSFRLQSGALGDDKKDVEYFCLVPSTTFPTKDVCSGEHVDSVRGLMQKFTMSLTLGRIYKPQGGTRIITNHLIPYPSLWQHVSCLEQPLVTTNPQCFTWAGYYSSLFVGIAASVRYKIISNSGNGAIVFGANALTTTLGLNTSSALSNSHISSVNPLWAVQDGEAVEIMVPYYFNKKYLPCYGLHETTEILTGGADSRVNALEARVKAKITNASYDNGATVYVAYGPDIRFHMFRFVPAIRTATANLTPIWNSDLTGLG
jgi:hypothetical protein